MNIAKLLKNFLEITHKECLDVDEINTIFGGLERSDERGWYSVESIFVNDDNDLIGFTRDCDGGENDVILYLSIEEEEKLINYITNYSVFI